MGTESVRLWILLVFTQLAASLVSDHLPYSQLSTLKVALHLHQWEQEGYLYQHLFHIRIWKDWVPVLGDHFQKDHLNKNDPAYLQQFILESVRAETCHLLSLLFALPLIRQAPAWAIIYMILINTPCVLIQRYNRPRLEKLLEQMLKKQKEKPSLEEFPVPAFSTIT